MVIGTLLGSNGILEEIGLHFEQLDCTIALTDSGDKAIVALVFGCWLEKSLPKGQDVQLVLLLPPRVTRIAVLGSQKAAPKYWISNGIAVNRKSQPAATITFSREELGDHTDLRFGLRYEIVSGNNLDLSIPANHAVRSVIEKLVPNAEMVSIEQVRLWLVYDPEKLDLTVTREATEGRVSGSDLVRWVPQLKNVVRTGTNYQRMVWEATNPTINDPFSLAVIVKPMTEETHALSEITATLKRLDQRLTRLEGALSGLEIRLQTIQNALDVLVDEELPLKEDLTDVSPQRPRARK